MPLKTFSQRSLTPGVGEYRRIGCFYYWACFYVINGPIWFQLESPFHGTKTENGKFTLDRKNLHLANFLSPTPNAVGLGASYGGDA